MCEYITAPGTYCPEKVDFGKGPQYSLTGKGYIDKLDNLPGKDKIHFYFCSFIKII